MSKSEDEATQAIELLEIVRKLEAKPHLTQEQQEKIRLIKAQLAGFASRPWLPLGYFRKLLVLTLLILGGYTVAAGNLLGIIPIVFASLFSPNIVSRIMMTIWRAQGIRSRQRKPETAAEQPGEDFLAWHNERVFRG